MANLILCLILVATCATLSQTAAIADNKDDLIKTTNELNILIGNAVKCVEKVLSDGKNDGAEIAETMRRASTIVQSALHKKSQKALLKSQVVLDNAIASGAEVTTCSAKQDVLRHNLLKITGLISTCVEKKIQTTDETVKDTIQKMTDISSQLSQQKLELSKGLENCNEIESLECLQELQNSAKLVKQETEEMDQLLDIVEMRFASTITEWVTIFARECVNTQEIYYLREASKNLSNAVIDCVNAAVE